MQKFSECLFLLSTMQECGKKSKQDAHLFSNILYLAEFQTGIKGIFKIHISVSAYLCPARFHTGDWTGVASWHNSANQLVLKILNLKVEL